MASVGRNSREQTKVNVYANNLMIVFYDQNVLCKRCTEMYMNCRDGHATHLHFNYAKIWHSNTIFVTSEVNIISESEDKSICSFILKCSFILINSVFNLKPLWHKVTGIMSALFQSVTISVTVICSLFYCSTYTLLTTETKHIHIFCE
jgi:hypothetical protein